MYGLKSISIVAVAAKYFNKGGKLSRRNNLLNLLIRQELKSPRLVGRGFALLKKILLIGTGCELPSISFEGMGNGVLFPHLDGIIIHPNARVGKNYVIFQQVTIGVNGKDDFSQAASIGDNVTIGAGAKLIGRLTVGDDVVIGANAVVTKSVPSESVVVGANRILNKNASDAISSKAMEGKIQNDDNLLGETS